MAQVTIYATKQTRFNGERANPGDKFVVSDEEVGNILSSGRFSTEQPKASKSVSKTDDKKQDPPKA